MGPVTVYFDNKLFTGEKVCSLQRSVYNLENLFDTIHDAGKNDFEYLPNGKNKWNSMKYEAKLKTCLKY